MLRTHFTRTLVAAALAAVGSVAVPASASGYLLSSNASRFACKVLNVGAKSVKITSAKVILESGTPFADFNQCAGATLTPGTSCTVTGPSGHMAGIVTVEGTTKGLRGTCMLLTSGNNVVATTEMR